MLTLLVILLLPVSLAAVSHSADQVIMPGGGTLADLVPQGVTMCTSATSGGDCIDNVGPWSGTPDIHYTAGNVGIGTTDPQALLHVNGNIRANNIRLSGIINGIPFCNAANKKLATDGDGWITCADDLTGGAPGPVNWDSIIGIPAGFADNIDNIGSEDNLGNHQATSTLDLNSQAIVDIGELRSDGSNFDILYGQGDNVFIKSATPFGGVYIGNGGNVPLFLDGSLNVGDGGNTFNF